MKLNYNKAMIGVITILIIITGSLFINEVSNTPTITSSFPRRIQGVLPSVVHVMAERWQGSGVALTKDIVVTARHVIDRNDYTITLNDGRTVKGIKAISSKEYDIGFIKVAEPILTPAKFGSISDCVLGQSVFIIGSPYGQINFNNISLGIVSGVNKNWDMIDPYTGERYGWEIVFTSDSAAHPGNSGGPVFTMDGVVRGLLVGGASPVLNCSMPSDLFLNDIQTIERLFEDSKYKVIQESNEPVYMELEVCNEDR